MKEVIGVIISVFLYILSLIGCFHVMSGVMDNRISSPSQVFYVSMSIIFVTYIFMYYDRNRFNS